MSVTHPAAVRNALADLVVDGIDAGAGAGVIEFQTAGDVEVATCVCGDPAAGAAVNGVATFNAIAPDTNATGGTITKARAKDSDGVEKFACSVTGVGGGGDIEITSTVVVATEGVEISSLSYEAAP